LSRWKCEEDRQFLFPDDRLVGRLLTAHPVIVFFLLALSCCAILFLPAWALGLNSIVVPFHQAAVESCSSWDNAMAPSQLHDVGILHKWNWSVTYSLIVPTIFAMAAAACRSVRGSILQLVDEGTVQSDVSGNPINPLEFLRVIGEGIHRLDKRMILYSIAVAVIASGVAAKNNLRVYRHVFLSPRNLQQWYPACKWDDIDWMHAWTISGHHHGDSFGYMLANFLFYLLANAVQGTTIFLASYFVLKFLTMTQSFANVLIDKNSGYRFEPFISDPDRCLGLRPIGSIFSMFLLLSILFQIFAFWMRLHKIIFNQNVALFDYFKGVGGAIRDLGNAVDEQKVTNSMNFLIHRSGFGKGDLDPGLVAILILMVVPLSVIAWWPLIRLRNYVSCVRQEQLRSFRLEEQKARQTQKYDVAGHIASDMDKLTKSSIWPNGFKVGWGSFFFLFALLISTIIPPLIVPLVSGGIGLKLFNKITSD